jgi:hypothetical protein
VKKTKLSYTENRNERIDYIGGPWQTFGTKNIREIYYDDF